MSKHSVHLKLQKSLLVLKASDYSRIKSDIIEIAVIGWEEEIEIISLDDKKLSRHDLKNRAINNSHNLLIKFSDENFSRIIIQSDAPLDFDYLEHENLPVKLVKSRLTLIQVINDELKSRNLHWLGRSMSEWEKSSIPHASPDVMVQQFAELGYPQIGKHLLKSLRVVTKADLKNAFMAADPQNLGFNVIHAFVHDDEPGSSSFAVKDVLEHLHPINGSVVTINASNLKDLTCLNADVVYVYEDGLWSGVELVKRLNLISGSEDFKKSNVQFHFKFGVTSDAGLIAARLFSKREKISRFQFSPAILGNHFTFLKAGTNSCFPFLEDRNDDAIRKALDAEIEPFAFREEAGWGTERGAAISVCSNIGKQLIKPFLERREIEKESAGKIEAVEAKNPEISQAKIDRWALGALNFASTIVFDSSIPKPVLPLFWLNGTVSLNGKTVKWRPLFWDARRTGTADKS